METDDCRYYRWNDKSSCLRRREFGLPLCRHHIGRVALHRSGYVTDHELHVLYPLYAVKPELVADSAG